MQVPSRSRGELYLSGSVTSSSGEFRVVSIAVASRLYYRRIDEIMQEEETEKLGHRGRTGERLNSIGPCVARLARVRVPV